MSIPTLDEPTARPEPPARPPGLSPVELGRWAWRQLTSMRTALLLLLLLALASIPGSVVPQSNIAALRVSQWKDNHPTLAPIYDRLGLFSVYDSPWFSAIYILLMVSLVGCIIPRLLVYWRALRASPPAAPKNLQRLPAYHRTRSEDTPDVVLERARTVLRGRRYRVVGSGDAVSAERGYLREAGNLLFHVSVVIVLIAFAYGQLFGYKGGVIVLVGKGFSNSLTQYDDFSPGSLFDPADLPPLSFTVDDFQVKFLRDGPQRGQPASFHADVSYRETPGDPAHDFRLEVNKPLVLDGVSVFLVGHGYAANMTVRDGNGDLAWKAPVVFLPQDASFESFGVLKVPEARPDQLGFDGLFFPSYAKINGDPTTIFPDALNPTISMLAYKGDLGMDDGRPQSLFELDTSAMTRLKKPDGSMFRVDLQPGQTTKLPDGAGTVRFDGYQRWVKLQVSNTPGKGIALGGVALGLVGLMGSLFVRRRRAWVRVLPDGDGSRVEVGGLDRTTAGEGLDEEVRRVAALVSGRAEDPGPGADDPGTVRGAGPDHDQER